MITRRQFSAGASCIAIAAPSTLMAECFGGAVTLPLRSSTVSFYSTDYQPGQERMLRHLAVTARVPKNIDTEIGIGILRTVPV